MTDLHRCNRVLTDAPLCSVDSDAWSSDLDGVSSGACLTDDSAASQRTQRAENDCAGKLNYFTTQLKVGKGDCLYAWFTVGWALTIGCLARSYALLVPPFAVPAGVGLSRAGYAGGLTDCQQHAAETQEACRGKN